MCAYHNCQKLQPIHPQLRGLQQPGVDILRLAHRGRRYRFSGDLIRAPTSSTLLSGRGPELLERIRFDLLELTRKIRFPPSSMSQLQAVSILFRLLVL